MTSDAGQANDAPNVPSFNDAVDAWVKAAADAERRWNEFFSRQMNSEEFTKLYAQQMESFAAVQAGIARGMEQSLRAMGIPTRGDLAALAERVASLEQRLSALEAAAEEGGAGAPTEARPDERDDAPASADAGASDGGGKRSKSKGKRPKQGRPAKRAG